MTMPSTEAIQNSLAGAWAMMLGRKDGLKQLDLSADGFWDSFWALPLSLPPLILGWTLTADNVASATGIDASRLSIILRLAIVDLVNWLLPLVVLALAAKRIGIAKRFVPYVVASNWASVIIVWFGLPVVLLSMLSQDAQSLGAILSLCIFVISMVLFWQLTSVALEKDTSTTATVYIGVLIVSLLVVIILPAMLGVA